MPTGRKPKPSMLAKLHGRTNHARKANPAEPRPTGDLFDVPDWLTKDQRAGWDYAIRCAPAGLLKRIDRGALTAWVIAEDLHRQAAILQAQNHLLVLAPKTQTPMQSPYLSIINRQALIMLKAASDLGFTPTSRPRILSAPPASDDDGTGFSLDDFLRTDPDLLQ